MALRRVAYDEASTTAEMRQDAAAASQALHLPAQPGPLAGPLTVTRPAAPVVAVTEAVRRLNPFD